ncbi:40S ribosomal protein S27-1 [Nymphaea thermarum]|nr:40S ribosomal protein S27-1 [Nymphaea thermarum]
MATRWVLPPRFGNHVQYRAAGRLLVGEDARRCVRQPPKLLQVFGGTASGIVRRQVSGGRGVRRVSGGGGRGVTETGLVDYVHPTRTSGQMTPILPDVFALRLCLSPTLPLSPLDLSDSPTSARGRGTTNQSSAGRWATSAFKVSLLLSAGPPSPFRSRASLDLPLRFSSTVRRNRQSSGEWVFAPPVLSNDIDLLHPPAELEKRKHKLKRLVQSPNSFFMDVKCQGCFNMMFISSCKRLRIMKGSEARGLNAGSSNV